MTRTLIVGDPHVVPSELKDCEALRDLVLETILKHRVEVLIITGDLYHTHSVLNTPTIEYWNKFFGKVELETDCKRVVALVGNHDFFSPTVMKPHALVANQHHFVGDLQPVPQVVDKPILLFDGVAAMPYYAEPGKFLEACQALQLAHPTIKTLICHQTFDGAKYNDGFYAKDGVNPVAVPFDNIISGHIHTQHSFGKVWYVGAPRWRTLNDANQQRFIYVLDFDNGSYEVVNKVSTSPTCRQIVSFQDSEEAQANFVVPENTDVRVDIYGTNDYISNRMIELKAKYNAKCRTFPTRTARVKLSEVDGIIQSFNKFSNTFVPPKGTDRQTLVKEAGARLGTP